MRSREIHLTGRKNDFSPYLSCLTLLFGIVEERRAASPCFLARRIINAAGQCRHLGISVGSINSVLRRSLFKPISQILHLK